MPSGNGPSGFLRCDVWFLDPWHAVKRTIGLVDRLAHWWVDDIDDADQSPLRWLYAEALGVLSLNLVALAGQRTAANQTEWGAFARDKLAEGVVPMSQMKVLSAAADRLMARVMGQLGASPEMQAEAIGSLLPEPRPWSDGALELIERLAKSPEASRQLPRHVDLVAHERLVHRRHVESSVLQRIDGVRGPEVDRARRQVGAFLRGHTRLPELIEKAISAPTV